MTPEQQKAIAIARARRRRAEAEANQQTAAPQEPQKTYSGSVLPFSKYDDGSVQFDSDAGVLGPIKRGFNLPGEVMAGEVDPMSPEGIDRAIEMGAVFGPTGVAGRYALPRGHQINPAKPAPPTTRQILAAGKKDYSALRNTGVRYDQDLLAQKGIQVGKKLYKDHGFTNTNSPQTFANLVKSVQNAEKGRSGIRDVHATLRKLRSISRKPTSGEDAAAAKDAADQIAAFIRKDGDGALVSGPKGVAKGLLDEADGNWSIASKTGAIEDALKHKELKTAAANSGLNLGNNIRSAAGDVATPLRQKKFKGLDPDDYEAFEGVAFGSKAANRARSVANRLGGGGGLGNTVLGGGGSTVVGGTAAVLGAGPVGIAAAAAAGAIPAIVGTSARRVANNMTQKAFNSALNRVKMRSPLYRRMLENHKPKHLSPASRKMWKRMGESMNKALVFELMAERDRERAAPPGRPPQQIGNGQDALKAHQLGNLQIDHY